MADKKRVLIIGGSGFVGAHLVVAALAHGYEVAYTYLNRSFPVKEVQAKGYQVALERPDERLEICLTDFQPQTVIYCAVPPFVYANGDEVHQQVSVEGVRRSLKILGRVAPDALFVYISTNAVFGGGRGLYREVEIPDPEVRQDPYRTYALTKAAGEQIAVQNWPNTLIARTAVVDGRYVTGALYPRTAGMVESLKAGQILVRFRDRYISPTLIDNFAEAVLEVIEPTFNYRGVLHLAGSERVTDYQYASYLARHLGLDQNLIQAESIAASPAMANSPRDHSLDVSFTQSLLQTRLLGVEAQLACLFPAE